MLESPAAPQPDTPSAGRLVIRVKLTQEPPQPTPPPRRLSKGALLLIVGAIAVVLGWLAVRAFKADPADTPAAIETASNSDAARLAPPQKPATAAASPPATAAKPVEPEVRREVDAPPSTINKVLPAVSQSALDTIRGTIRVSIRVSIDKSGAVVETSTDERGPSRYFERHALDASKQWTFTPTSADERRPMLIAFSFTRSGVTARAKSPP